MLPATAQAGAPPRARAGLASVEWVRSEMVTMFSLRGAAAAAAASRWATVGANCSVQGPKRRANVCKREFAAIALLALATVAGCAALELGAGRSSVVESPSSASGAHLQPGVTAAELLRARGFKAREHYFITRDGYILNIVRGTNPLFNKGRSGLRRKFPILFVHGATIAGASYLINSAGARPRNYLALLARRERGSLKRLIARLAGEGSARSLPLLALNFGYEIWILDRRGSMKSRNKVGHLNRSAIDALKSIPLSLFGNFLSGFTLIGGMIPGRPNRRPHRERASARRSAAPTLERLIEEVLLQKILASGAPETRLLDIAKSLAGFPLDLISDPLLLKEAIRTFDPDYWDFSLDEQAEHDLPAAVDFILARTSQPKVHLVTLSCGGAVALLGLAHKPKLAHKIGQAVHWAPSLTLGTETDVVYLMGLMSPIMQGYAGPLPPTFAVKPVERLLQAFCGQEVRRGQKSKCERLMDLIFGFSGRQAPMAKSFWANAVQSMSVNEMTHLGQLARTKRPCKFSFNTPQKNLERYNQREPPCYDLSRIRLSNMSFYVGKYDRLVSWASVNMTLAQLSVPSKLTVIKERGIYFNHLGFILHSDTSRLAIVPSLFDLESYERAKAEGRELAGASWQQARKLPRRRPPPPQQRKPRPKELLAKVGERERARHSGTLAGP